MVLRQVIPAWIIATSFVKREINSPGLVMKIRAINPRRIILNQAAAITDRSALRGSLAPRFWPTRVPAALARPQEGSKVKIRIRIPIKYPATTSVPKPLIIRTINIQLEVAIRF
jgi:hypothetical protein